MKTSEQVVITGAGLVSSLGRTTDENWEALCAGKSGIKSISGFDAGGFSCGLAAEVGKIDPETLGIHPRDARIMDTHAYLLMMASRNAFRNAGLDRAAFAPEDIGFYAGMGMVDYGNDDILPAVMKSLGSEGSIDYPAFYEEGYREIYPLWPLSMLNNITFCQVGIDLGIRGENAVFCPHADAGAQAITEGMRTIFEHRAKAVLAGGVSEKVSPLSIARLHLSGVAMTSIKTGSITYIPFSGEDRGTVMGEGAGIISLELRDSADRRGAAYSCMISGYGHAFGLAEAGPAPSAETIGNAMRQALKTASLSPEDIDLIIAHGDGSVFGDLNEAEAVTAVFGKRTGLMPVFSSKAALGNLFAGAPAADIILGMQMIEKGIIPAMIPDKYQRSQHAAEAPGPVTGEAQKKELRRIMVNCQSYEGQAASIIIGTVT
ncbi:MAG: hypothetical protein HZA15_09845 [Nitrospirae bacterium]|nr:hypothetical protein [Nitrospirota bacterium]